MSFEKRVLNRVTDVLGSEVRASFTCGTLFVTCTPRDAAMLETALNEVANSGVIVSKTPAEFAFDFVA
jgi:hypothetical protein